MYINPIDISIFLLLSVMILSGIKNGVIDEFKKTTNLFLSIISTNIIFGSLIGITSAGSLLDHFGNFVLASDSVEGNNRLVSGGNDSEETEKFNYNFENSNLFVIFLIIFFI